MFDDTNVDWVPTLKLGVDRQERDVDQASERHERRKNGRRTSLTTQQDVQVQDSWDSAMEGCSGEGVFPGSFQRCQRRMQLKWTSELQYPTSAGAMFGPTVLANRSILVYLLRSEH